MQAGATDPRRVEAAIEREPGFFWRVIECADNEEFPGVSARPTRQSLILECETLIDFWPRNLRERSRQNN